MMGRNDRIRRKGNNAILSIVTPAFNEAESIPELYRRISNVMSKECYDFELLVIENGSIDESLDILKDLNQKDKRIQYLSFTRNFGHQGALIAGLEHSRGDVVISMDADLQHPPEMIPQMLREWEQGFEIVYTKKRDVKTVSFLRKIMDNGFYFIMNKLSGIVLHGESDFRLLDRKAVDAICSMPEKNKFLRGLTMWVGFRHTGIEYTVKSRFAGQSKFTMNHLIKLAVDGIFAFSIIPLRIFTFTGLIISAISFMYGIYYSIQRVYCYFIGDMSSYPLGWATLIFSMLFLGGVQLIGIGLLGEYIGRVYDEVKGRPDYIVREKSFNN